MIEKYDYVIVGGGPTGMTIAWLFGSKNKKVLLIEKEEMLGGCHRVHRVDGYFSEHGPRIYSNSYLTFIRLLKKMGIDFYHIFKEVNLADTNNKGTKFNLSKINNRTIWSFSFNEKKALVIAFIKLIINNEYGKTISVKEFMDKNNFSEDSKDYLNKFVRLTDGASAENYTLYQFLQILNQELFHKMYQPKVPNDKGLIYLWENKLKSVGVTILKNTKVVNIDSENGKIVNIVALVNGVSKVINGTKFILCVPPKPMYNLIKDSNIDNDIDKLYDWQLKNSYFDFIPLTFHYNNDISFPKVNGFPNTPWGIAFIILSNYMQFTEEPSKKVISITITFTDVPNEEGKTANQCSKEEIINYVKKKLPFFPNPDKVIISQNVIRFDDKWVNLDTAYVVTTENKFIDTNSDKFNNLFTVGIFNGNSNYPFTSIESAVQNAISFAIIEIPDLKYEYYNKKHMNLVEIIHDIFVLIIFIFVLFVIKKVFFTNIKK